MNEVNMQKMHGTKNKEIVYEYFYMFFNHIGENGHQTPSKGGRALHSLNGIIWYAKTPTQYFEAYINPKLTLT